jgi:dihydroorotase
MGDFLDIPMPDDFHVHLRQGPLMTLYAKRHALSFGRAMVMPNTVPPIRDVESLIQYKTEIENSVVGGEKTKFTPLMTFKLLPGMRADLVQALADAGAIAGKYYPSGSTTNSSDGPRSPEDVREALEAMEALGIVLSIHGEEPKAPVFRRETAFLTTVEKLLADFPRLRIVLEHLSMADSVSFVGRGPERLAGTITAHHLLFTCDDMLDESMNPHLYCKPILKRASDREALQGAVATGDGRFFFGSDSAPHPRSRKESGAAPGGVYSSPTAIPALAQLFEEIGILERLASFTGKNGASFYRLPQTMDVLRLEHETWVVPGEIDGSVPMCAGATLEWRIASPPEFGN